MTDLSILSASVLLTIAVILSLAGWGRLTGRALKIVVPWAQAPTLGMATVLPLGGLLACFEIAYPPSIYALLFVGLLASVGAALRHSGNNGFPRLSALSCVSAVMVIINLIFYHNPTAFNPQDDLLKYFNYPTILAETGTLAPGPFDSLGSETLGGMTILHSFTATILGSRSLLLFDSVIAYACCLAQIIWLTKRVGLGHWIRWGIVLLFGIADPMLVNISPMYTTSSLLLLSVSIPVIDPKYSASSWIAVALLSVIYAAMVVIKTSAALYVPFHFTALFIICLWPERKHQASLIQKAIRLISAIPISCFVASPWFLLYSKNLLIAFNPRKSETIFGTEVIHSTRAPWTDFFRFEALDFSFGVSPVLFLLLLLGAFISLIALWQHQHSVQQGLRAFQVSSIVFILINVFLFSPQTVGVDSGFRYTLPSLLCLIVVSGLSLKNARTGLRRIVYAVGIACVLLFTHSYVKRLSHYSEWGNALAISNPEVTRQATQALLREDQLTYCLQLQQLSAESSKILVYGPSQFHFDYKRNEIWNVNLAGLSNPWLSFPFSGSLDERMAWLKYTGIEYIIWQSGGTASIKVLEGVYQSQPPRRATIAKKAIILTETLTQIAEMPGILTIHSDPVSKVYKID